MMSFIKVDKLWYNMLLKYSIWWTFMLSWLLLIVSELICENRSKQLSDVHQYLQCLVLSSKGQVIQIFLLPSPVWFIECVEV